MCAALLFQWCLLVADLCSVFTLAGLNNVMDVYLTVVVIMNTKDNFVIITNHDDVIFPVSVWHTASVSSFNSFENYYFLKKHFFTPSPIALNLISVCVCVHTHCSDVCVCVCLCL